METGETTLGGIPTPVFYPSVSSVSKNVWSVIDHVELLVSLDFPQFLVSCFDVYKFQNNKRLLAALNKAQDQCQIVLWDSGIYEVAWSRSKRWCFKRYIKTLRRNKVSHAFGFDDYTGGKSIVATHEIGHFLNLHHIWGDNTPNCGNDSVADTPPAYSDNSGCPTFPHSPNDSCGTNANGQMFMNYMDYSDASCTVMFSNGQKNRMLATLTTVRNSLTISGKCGSLSSISEDKINNDFTIYPNPNNGNFTINASKINNKNTTVFVYNSIGKVVKTFSAVNFPAEINLENLEQGVYFVSFKSKNSLITKKVHIVK